MGNVTFVLYSSNALWIHALMHRSFQASTPPPSRTTHGHLTVVRAREVGKGLQGLGFKAWSIFNLSAFYIHPPQTTKYPFHVVYTLSATSLTLRMTNNFLPGKQEFLRAFVSSNSHQFSPSDYRGEGKSLFLFAS